MKNLSTFAIQLYHITFIPAEMGRSGGGPLRGDSLGHDTAIQSAQHITQC